MKWSYSFHAQNKEEARANIQAESANCPITDILHRAIEALPADRPFSLSTFGEFSDAESERTEQDREPTPAIGKITISIQMG